MRSLKARRENTPKSKDGIRVLIVQVKEGYAKNEAPRNAKEKVVYYFLTTLYATPTLR